MPSANPGLGKKFIRPKTADDDDFHFIECESVIAFTSTPLRGGRPKSIKSSGVALFVADDAFFASFLDEEAAELPLCVSGALLSRRVAPICKTWFERNVSY